jgi:uncharacterized protein YwqG
MHFERKMMRAAQRIRDNKAKGTFDSDDKLLIFVGGCDEDGLPDSTIRKMIAFYNADQAGFLNECARLEAACPPEPPPPARERGPLTLAEFKQMIAQCDMKKDTDALVGAMRIGHVLETGDEVESDELAVGSRFRGRPAMASEAKWPEWQGKPMQFICQVNLADLPPGGPAGILPPEGLLSFFCMPDWSYEGPDGGRIIYSKALSGLSLRPTPDGVEEYPAKRINVVPNVMCLPPWESDRFDALDLGDEACENYSDFWHEFNAEQKPEQPVHMLLGYPDQIQGDLEYDANQAAGTEGARWRLCLQVDTDEAINTQWGDEGRIYYMLPEDEGAPGDFSLSCVVMQCG